MSKGGKEKISIKNKFWIIFFVSFSIFSYSNLLHAASTQENFMTFKGKHFVVQIEGEQKGFGQDVLREAERFYDSISASLGCPVQNKWLWEGRCEIFVYADKESYLKNSKAPEWSNASSSYYPRKTIQGYRASKTFLTSELPHEISHLLFREYVGAENKNVPLWLDEGIAVFHEAGQRGVVLEKLIQGNAPEGKMISLEELCGMGGGMAQTSWSSPDASSTLTFYAYSYSFVKFLVERYGQAQFTKFLRDFTRGRDFKEALERNYRHSFRDLQGLEKEWNHSIRVARSI